MRYIYNGKDVTYSAFEDSDGIKYPANWAQLANKAERDNLGIIEQAEPAPTPLTLDQVYQAKINEISNARTEASNSTFTHDGRTFSANTLAKESILSTHGEVLATNAMPTGWLGAWMDASGNPYVIGTVAQWKSFYNSYYATGLGHAGKATILQGQATAIYNDANKTDETKITEINLISW